MSARQGVLLIAGFGGVVATLAFYLLLFFVQIQNADNACESLLPSGPGPNAENVRGIGFENSYLSLGGACTYYMNDGSVVHTREPGWWFSGMVAGVIGAFAVLVIALARRKDHRRWLYGLAALLPPPLGLLLAVAAPRRG